MTSQDSGIETGNDSNDSSYPTQEQNEPNPSKITNFRYQPVPLNSQIQTALSKIGIGLPINKPSSSSQTDDSSYSGARALPTPSTPVQESINSISRREVKEAVSPEVTTFRLPIPLSSMLEPPAGISIANFQPAALNLGNGYEVVGIGQDYVYRNIELQLKLKAVRCRLRSARDSWSQFKTPLDERKLRRAVATNNVEIVESLLATGVNPNSADGHRRTPLHLAACRGYVEILRLLLANGADPNRKDSLGNTPLHIAACTNNVQVVTMLIKAGTDVSSGDNNGRNPLQIAQSKLKLLQRCGSDDARRIKIEVAQVVEMMQTFLSRSGQDSEAELLAAFSSRLSLSDTPAQVETDVRDLLASLSGLSLSNP